MIFTFFDLRISGGWGSLEVTSLLFVLCFVFVGFDGPGDGLAAPGGGFGDYTLKG